METLFRVFVHTQGDESIREYVVTASSEKEARERALDHVKAANPGKGDRSKAESERLTEILAIRPTSRPHCLMIHSVPLAVVDRLLGVEI